MRSNRHAPLFVTLVVLVLAHGDVGRAEVPYPSCASARCSDPTDFPSYLFRHAGSSRKPS